MIKYTRNADGTYTKTGGFESEPTEVRIQVADGRPFAGGYTLAQATAIIEDGIAKNQVQKDSYCILPMETKAPKAAKEPKTPKEPKAPREPKAPKPPKAPKMNKYSADDFVRIYKETGSLDEVVKQTGASRVWSQRVLVKLGVYVKPAKVAKPEVTLTAEEEARIAQILLITDAASTGPVADLLYPNRQAAVKQLRKEQRIAARPPKAPKAPRVLKYSKDDFAAVYAKNHDLKEVCAVTGASPVWAQRVLVRLGVWVKPVKAVKEVPAPVEAPAVEPVAPAAKPAKAPKAAKPAAPKAAKPAATPKATKKSKGTTAPADAPAAQ